MFYKALIFSDITTATPTATASTTVRQECSMTLVFSLRTGTWWGSSPRLSTSTPGSTRRTMTNNVICYYLPHNNVLIVNFCQTLQKNLKRVKLAKKLTSTTHYRPVTRAEKPPMSEFHCQPVLGVCISSLKVKLGPNLLHLHHGPVFLLHVSLLTHVSCPN